MSYTVIYYVYTVKGICKDEGVLSVVLCTVYCY